MVGDQRADGFCEIRLFKRDVPVTAQDERRETVAVDLFRGKRRELLVLLEKALPDGAADGGKEGNFCFACLREQLGLREEELHERFLHGAIAARGGHPVDDLALAGLVHEDIAGVKVEMEHRVVVRERAEVSTQKHTYLKIRTIIKL